MSISYETRYAIGPKEAKGYRTDELREAFLIENLFQADTIQLTYTHYDRYIVGGASPVNKILDLETIDPLKSNYFLERRELGVINIGGQGSVVVDGERFYLENQEALYVGSGAKEVKFSSLDSERPAKFYLNSAPAHCSYPVTKITKGDVKKIELGAPETSNDRVIYQFIVAATVQTCQLQMGMTTLKPGSGWNTMPAHQHDRRMEAYLYFGLTEGEAVCHFMGQPKETRHIWMANEQAVLSPPWSIHCGSGTSNYTFIWGMAGENLDYNDMDKYLASELR